jgi:hypothetical protein
MTDKDKIKDTEPAAPALPVAGSDAQPEAEAETPEEFGGPKGLEPTRYGDWERKGILSDF